MGKSTLILKLFLLSDPRMLCVVRAATGEMAATSGFPPGDARSIVLALDEAMTNVIRHAYLGKHDRPIDVSFYRRTATSGDDIEDLLEIRIVDRGKPLDFKKLRGRELDEVRPGGLGLHFMREIMDKVSFRHSRGRNYLRLVKLLPSSKPSDPAGDTQCS